MPRIIRPGRKARVWLRDASRKGLTHLPPDGIAVKGHCVGAVGRAFCGSSAGYPSAHAMLEAVRRAGKLRGGKPPLSAVVFFRGGKYGHVAVQTWYDTVWGTDNPVVGQIGRVKRSKITEDWGYVYAGWCWAKDVPGWTKA